MELINTMPPRLSLQEFVQKMRVNHFINPDDLPQDVIERRNMLSIARFQWFQVTDKHYEIYNHIYDIVNQRYEVCKGEYFNIVTNLKDWEANINNKDLCLSLKKLYAVDNLTIIGMPGVGKSSAVENILRICFPAPIKHFNDSHTLQHYITTQVFSIKVNCPSSGSIKGIADSFFRHLDLALGVDMYYRKYSNSKWSAEKLAVAIGVWCHQHHLGCLCIDELGNMDKIRSVHRKALMNFFKNLSEYVAIPIIFIGAYDSVQIMCENYQILRRLESGGIVVWDKLQKGDKEFETVLKSMWKLQYLKNPGQLTKKMIDAYYEVSEGILSKLINIHIAAQKRALQLKLETLNEDLIRQVDLDSMQLSRPIIDSLRSNDQHRKNLYGDVNSDVLTALKTTKATTQLDQILEIISKSTLTAEGIKTVETIINNTAELTDQEKYKMSQALIDNVTTKEVKESKESVTKDSQSSIIGNESTLNGIYEAVRNNSSTVNPATIK
ncbi:MAG: ATP-binding protein [Cyclobacteriaceae bacterium]|nr:ATP-binding protein [Cyclobacteriaceae bacterium]